MARTTGERLKERYEKVRADYLKHQQRERQKRRRLKSKEAIERKLVAGEFVLYLLENGEYDRERFMTRLDKYLDDNRRRSLFGLELSEEAPTTTETNTSLPLVEQEPVES